MCQNQCADVSTHRPTPKRQVKANETPADRAIVVLARSVVLLVKSDQQAAKEEATELEGGRCFAIEQCYCPGLQEYVTSKIQSGSI
jgi:hypothetical protein